MMKQLLLDLAAEKPQTLDTFVTGSNAELVKLLRAHERHASSVEQSFVYIWGPSGAGKTHLLRGLARLDRTRFLAPGAGEPAFHYDPAVQLYLVDDCDKLSPEEQISVFAIYNQARENQGALIACGHAAPAHLKLREDLRTRLGWGLIYQIRELSDEEKIAALDQAATARGFTLSPGVLPYLLTHFKRDMRSLSAMLDALDNYSLETKRPITLPLLRDLLQQDRESTAQ